MTKFDVSEARTEALEIINPGDTVYTILGKVASSGMSRVITPLIMRVDAACTMRAAWDNVDRGITTNAHIVNLGDGLLQRFYLGHIFSRLLGHKRDANQGLRISGCGMDMGFQLVYEASAALFPEGFDCIGKDCPSNDHSNARFYNCAICGKDLTPADFYGEPRDLTGTSRGAYQGRDWEPTDAPRYSIVAGGRTNPVCSQDCRDATWHHRDGGYALRQKWL